MTLWWKDTYTQSHTLCSINFICLLSESSSHCIQIASPFSGSRTWNDKQSVMLLEIIPRVISPPYLRGLHNLRIKSSGKVLLRCLSSCSCFHTGSYIQLASKRHSSKPPFETVYMWRSGYMHVWICCALVRYNFKATCSWQTWSCFL